MGKEEANRLLSKVAKFVRNPLKDWSELDSEEPAALENGYSREMLKEMIERRQRNDFVRRREFDMLRKLRQREAAGGRDAAATPSSFNVSSTSGKSEGRALTLKKIDEIEEQMSQQWWKARAARTEDGQPKSEEVAAEGGQMAVQHARSYADTVPGVPQPGDAAQPQVQPAHDESIEESAVLFAHGDDAGAEAILLQALAPDWPTSGNDDTWLTLLDFYRATGDAEKFVATATRYAQRMKRNAPEWISLRALAHTAHASTAPQPLLALEPAGGADWSSPACLTREGLIGLTRALTAAGAVWKLDWRALEAIEADASAPLRALFNHWADSVVQLRFAGADQLLLVLAEATPASDRNVDAVWWQLHMAALRVMHRPDEFELLALNYCITYEVSPPPWEDPKGEYGPLDLPKAARAANTGLSALMADPKPAVDAPAGATLVGELAGESHSTWQRLDHELDASATPAISCAALVRVDSAAGDALLDWVTAHHARGNNLQFFDAHRLIAAYFGVIGIADHASVAVRKD